MFIDWAGFLVGFDFVALGSFASGIKVDWSCLGNFAPFGDVKSSLCVKMM